MVSQLATRGWMRISTRWLYLGPVGADWVAVGRPMGARGCEQNRNAGMWGIRGRGRKLVDESRSGSTRGKVVVRDQPSVTAAIVRFFLSSPSFYFLFVPLTFLSRFSPPPLPDRTLPLTLRFLSRLSRPKLLASLIGWTYTFGKTRDVTRGSMATFTATTQIVLTGNELQESQEGDG